MATNVRYIGLDIHKDSIVIAVAENGVEPAKVLAGIPYDVSQLLKRLRKLRSAASVRCCYEAGPSGYELYRALKQTGIFCIVVAPSLIPIKSGNRVKTDRRDARTLAHFLRSGDLTAVWVPDEATEAMRDLERARGAAKKTERVARHQLDKFLLRHARRYEGGKRWTQKHLEWIARQQFAHHVQQRVLIDALHTVQQATARIERLTNDIAQLVEQWTSRPLVKALMAFRGIELVTAVTIAAEIGDLKRFDTAGRFMAFVGVIPSEHSSGTSCRRGSITKTGNGHVRRVLVEAAWSYRYQPRLSPRIRKRNEGISPTVQAIAWKAQVRLHNRYQRMMHRGMVAQKVITAIARELAGFVWAVGQEKQLLCE